MLQSENRPMSTESQQKTAPYTPEELASQVRWRLATRIGFRFAFTYVALYTFPFPFSPPSRPPSWLRTLWLRITPWVGAHVLGATVRPGAGDLGDAAEEYVRVLVLFALAVLGMVIWSV